MRAVLIALVVSLTACGGEEPVETTLANLKRFPGSFEGRPVVVSGTLRTHAPRHYWVEDGDLNRVGLAGDGDLAAQVGARVEVRGHFRDDPTRGRYIEVERLTVLP